MSPVLEHEIWLFVAYTGCRNELIGRVEELVSDERKRLERQRIEEERMNAPIGGSVPVNGAVDTGTGSPNGDNESGRTSSDGVKGHIPTGPMPEVERGLCVVCQDEEATLAVVDCG